MAEPIKTQATFRIALKCSGEIDAHLKRVVLAGLRTLDCQVPDNATVMVDDQTVHVTWHEETGS